MLDDIRFSTTIGTDPTPDKSDLPHLTPREWQTAKLIANGLSNKVIATALGISPHTVKFHITQLFEKLGVSTRTEIAVAYTRAGY